MSAVVSAVDGVFLAILLGSLLLGAWRGLAYELLSLMGWLVAVVAARCWADDVALWLPLDEIDGAVRYAAGFVLTFVGAAFAWGLVSALAKRLIDGVGLRPVDRTLGAVFGLLRGVLLLVVVALVVGYTPLLHADGWQQSWMGPVLSAWLLEWMPALPQEFGRYLPS